MKYYASSVIKKAASYVGYLEKKSNKDLNDFTANAGSANYTKFAVTYAAKAGINVQGQPWCDVFNDVMFIEAFGTKEASKLLGGFSAYTPTSASFYQKANRWTTGTPKPGYEVFYHNSTRICHTGIVESVDVTKGTITTIEGNTSKASGLIANGGGVARKTYPLSYERISGYGVPIGMTFDVARIGETSNIRSTQVTTNTRVKVSDVQTYLNKTYATQLKACAKTSYAELVVDNRLGSKTRAGVAVALQQYTNDTKSTSLRIDGMFGDKSFAACPFFKTGNKGPGVVIVKCILVCASYALTNLNDTYDEACANVVAQYQGARSLTIDKMFGPKCFDSYLRK